ncbi:hypothetical protein [Curtobacterium ammoniigenes]|uniref:hypothetical protein n=1 Tax=Curtobacterium ammoniigenes TaxID=395387 RepID=UPI0012EE92E0|nr:hypothetical protein [Curtobacterium ammoniigenes]
MRGTALHVVTIGSDRAMRRPGVVGHRTRFGARRLLLRDSLRIMHPIDIFVALASSLNVGELVELGDAIVTRFGGHASLAALREAVMDRRGARGIRRAREALALISTGSRSPGETRLRLLLQRSGCSDYLPNFRIQSRDGFVACVDIAFPQARVAIEYEGDVHRTDPRTFRKDITRGERLRDAGWWLIRATAYDLHRGRGEFLARVRRALSAAAPPIPIVEAST